MSFQLRSFSVGGCFLPSFNIMMFLMKTLVIVTTIGTILLPAGLALAQASPSPCPAGAVCIPNFLGADDFTELMDNIIGFLLVLAVPISVLTTIIGAFYLMLAGQDPANLTKAKNIFIYTFTGLAIIFLAKGLISALESLLGV
jgi:hypothetical protein